MERLLRSATGLAPSLRDTNIHVATVEIESDYLGEKNRERRPHSYIQGFQISGESKQRLFIQVWHMEHKRPWKNVEENKPLLEWIE